MGPFGSDFQRGGDSQRDIHYSETSSTKRSKRTKGLQASLHLE